MLQNALLTLLDAVSFSLDCENFFFCHMTENGTWTNTFETIKNNNLKKTNPENDHLLLVYLSAVDSGHCPLDKRLEMKDCNLKPC